MLTVSLFLKIAIIIASPTAASAAATVITKKTKTCPAGSPMKDENVTSARLAELSISSTHIKTTMAFRLISTPATPTLNMNALINKKYSIGIELIKPYSNFFLAKIIAPTVAASNRKPDAKNGRTYVVYNSVPIVSMVPALILSATSLVNPSEGCE